MMTSIASAVTTFFTTPVTNDHQNKHKIHKLDSFKIGTAAAVVSCALTALSNWPPYNKSSLLFGAAYLAFEGYKMTNNVQKILINNTQDKEAQVLFDQMTENTPVLRSLLPLCMSAEDLKVKIFGSN